MQANTLFFFKQTLTKELFILTLQLGLTNLAHNAIGATFIMISIWVKFVAFFLPHILVCLYSLI